MKRIMKVLRAKTADGKLHYFANPRHMWNAISETTPVVKVDEVIVTAEVSDEEFLSIASVKEKEN